MGAKHDTRFSLENCEKLLCFTPIWKCNWKIRIQNKFRQRYIMYVGACPICKGIRSKIDLTTYLSWRANTLKKIHLNVLLTMGHGSMIFDVPSISSCWALLITVHFFSMSMMYIQKVFEHVHMLRIGIWGLSYIVTLLAKLTQIWVAIWGWWGKIMMCWHG